MHELNNDSLFKFSSTYSEELEEPKENVMEKVCKRRFLSICLMKNCWKRCPGRAKVPIMSKINYPSKRR